MLVVEIVGGLGNQMFQYAFYIALKNYYKEQEIKLYTKRFEETSDNQGYELKTIFNVNSEYFELDAKDLIDDSMKVSARIRRKLLGFKPTYFVEKIYRYDESVFKLKSLNTIYVRGLWQDELYFKKYRNDLLRIFEFKTELNEKNVALLREIKNNNSVSLHIRRGDYVSNKKYQKILGDVCTYDYYNKGLNYIKDRIDSVSLYIFSDDIDWVKSNFDFLNNDKVTYINHNKGVESYIDMQLMSNCQHNIIANSTFSWWGAWLNQNPSKIVVAPKMWFKQNRGLNDNHIVPDSWVKINNIK